MPVMGITVVVWLGILAFVFLMAASAIAFVTTKGIRKWPVSWHVWAARIGTVFAFAHVVLALAAYL